MGATYTRQSTYAEGDVIQATDTNDEFDQLLAAFAASTGHTHDGTTGEGGPVTALLGTSITIGTGATGTDITVTFDGESNDGVLKWMEDEDYFEFSDDILIASTEKLQFRDTAIFINSSADGQLDIDADTELEITAPTVDINASTAVLISNDLKLDSDAAVLGFGADNDVTLTHVADTGLLLNSTMAIQFNDASQFINAPSATVLDINATDEIELNATLIDINGNVDVSGTLTVAGAVDFGDAALSNVGAVQLDSISGDADTNTSITFSGSDVITVATGGSTAATFNADQTTTFSGAVSGTSADFDSGVTIDNISIDGTEIDLSSGDLTVDVAGDIILDADGGDVLLKDAGTQYAALTNTSGNLIIKSGSTTAMTFSGANVTFAGTVTIGSAAISEAELEILDGATVTTNELNIIDGNTSATSTTVADADRVVLNDNGTMVQVAVTDLAAYFDDEITAMPNLVTTAATTVGALNTGSITSGFGAIDNGSSNITTTGLISGGSLDIDDVVINGSTIGHTDDTDLITVANGIATVAGELSVTTLDIGGTNITADAGELNTLNGITAVVGELNALDLGSTAIGTAIASKAVVLDSNKDYTGIRNLTLTGNLTIPDDGLFAATNTAGNILVADGTNFNSIAVGDLSEISTVADNDVLLAVDTSGGGLKKVTRSTIIAGTGSSGDLANVVEDTSPQLGGNLDTNSHNILIDDAHFIGDENGNEQIVFQTTSSAVNQIEVTNAATGNGVQIASTGGDTNIDLKLLPKGSGQVVIDGNVGIESGLIDLKNAGAVSKIKFYCESSNAHAQTLQGAPHSEAASNTLTLPSTGGNVNLVSTASTATLTNKTFGDNVGFGDNNITNVGDISLDSISADATDINIAVTDNSATAFTIKQGSDAYFVVDTGNSSESVSIGTGISGTAITIGHTTSETTVADNLTVTGNLTVSGTTTTVNSTTVNLNDHNIVLDSGNDTSAVINGAGITIEGGSGDDATFTYNTSGPKFELKLGSAHEDLQVGGLIATTGVFSGILKSDDTTDATSTTDGSLQTDGGLSVAKDAVLGDDVKLLSDAAVLGFGADTDVTLTHVADTGLLLNAAMVVQFRDSAINIGSPADGDLDINADDEIELNSTLIDVNGNLDVSGTIVGANALSATTGTFSGVLKTDDATEATSTTDGSLQTDGGLSVVKDAVFGDDVKLLSDAAVLSFGANSEVTLTHVHNDGLLLNADNQLQFRDSAINIRSDADGDLDINADDEIELNSTLIDINGNVEISGTAAITGIATFTDDIIIGDGKTIGSASDVDAITIASNGQVTFTQTLIGTDLDISGSVDVDGTLEADAITVNGTALAEVISDTTGAMFSSNTETGITVTYQDADNTIDLAVDAAQTGITSVKNTSLAIGRDNDNLIKFSTDNQIIFEVAGGDNVIFKSSGEIEATSLDISGAVDIDGALTTAAITASGVLKTDDATEATSTTDGSLQTDGGLSVVKDAVFGDDVKLLSDASVIHFGTNSEVTLTHVHNTGLALKHTATADDKPIVLTLQTGETDMAANDVIGKLAFQAPDESTGTDAILVAAAVQAVAEGNFSSSNNATRLEFHTGASEAAAVKMTLNSTGGVKPVTYQETYASLSAASTVDCDLLTANHFAVTIDQNTTFTFSNPPASGTSFAFTLIITQHSTAATLTWPGGVDWAGGSQPDIAGNNEVQAYGFITRDGGTTYYGFLGGSAIG